MPQSSSDPSEGGDMVDAERFLALTRRLKHLHERVEAATVTAEQRANWQRRIIGVTNTAQDNLEKAEAQLERLEADVERHAAT